MLASRCSKSKWNLCSARKIRVVQGSFRHGFHISGKRVYRKLRSWLECQFTLLRGVHYLIAKSARPSPRRCRSVTLSFLFHYDEVPRCKRCVLTLGERLAGQEVSTGSVGIK
jgi:hypothetical protein